MPVKTEADELDPDPPEEFRRTLQAIRYLERAVTGSSQPEGIVLRYGSFYGPGTGMFASAMVEQLRHRRVPLIGDGGGWWSFVHVDDAASATVKAIERGKPGNIYNIVDDDPAEVRQWLPALAKMLGAKPPFHLPAWIARLVAGEHMVAMMTRGAGRIECQGQDGNSIGGRLIPHGAQGFAAIARQSLEQTIRRVSGGFAQPTPASQRLALEPGVDALDHLAVMGAKALLGDVAEMRRQHELSSLRNG